jgi:hypothetical protein
MLYDGENNSVTMNVSAQKTHQFDVSIMALFFMPPKKYDDENKISH